MTLTLFPLLTKELRLRMRHERTVWVLVFYVGVLGAFAWITLQNSLNSPAYLSLGINMWSIVGGQLYRILVTVQLLLILFITPAFTASLLNGEKERQTYDMLLCSRLSSFSLVFGKLFSGLTNALLLIVASLPVFSLVLFFGGIAPLQIVKDVLLFVITAVLVATLGIFCSTVFKRPAVSTVTTYLLLLLWIGVPFLVQAIRYQYGGVGVITLQNGSMVVLANTSDGTSAHSYVSSGLNPYHPSLTYIWNPIVAQGNIALFSLIPRIPLGLGMMGSYTLAGLSFSPRMSYTVLSTVASLLLFLLSLWFARPHRLQSLFRRKRYPVTVHPETSSVVTTS